MSARRRYCVSQLGAGFMVLEGCAPSLGFIENNAGVP